MIKFNTNVKFDISSETNDALIAAVKLGLAVQAWMTAMGTGQQVPPAACAPNVAWAELLRRSNEAKETCIVKTFVNEAMKNKVFVIGPDGMSCISANKEVPFVHMGGFIVPEVLVKAEKTKAAVANEVAIECMLFAQDGDPNSRRKTVTTIDPVKAAEFNIPVYPIVAALQGGHHKVVDIEASFRNEEKSTSGFINDMLVSNMPKTLPDGKSMEWRGCSFAPRIPYRKPKVLNANSLFQTIADHRRIRGADSGRRSLYTKGYYYGYMDSPTSRAAFLVADLENLARKTSGLRFLEIQQIDGLFTEVALTSLISNGWIIRVINGYNLKILDCKENKDKPAPGVYSRVVNCTAPFFVYENLDEKTPTIVKDDSTKKYEVNLPPILDRLGSMHDKGEGRVHFTYVYYRDELTSVAKNLYATAHAHAAQFVYCTIGQEAPMNMHAYALRVLLANAYKTGFVYYRVPFFSKDEYAFDFKFSMTVKSKLKPSKAWTQDDFEVHVIDSQIDIIKIDYASLQIRAPAVAKFVGAYNGVDPYLKKTMLMEVKKADDERLMNENDQATLFNKEKIKPKEPEYDMEDLLGTGFDQDAGGNNQDEFENIPVSEESEDDEEKEKT